METGYATVRNLLYAVLALLVIAILSNFYVATQLSRNSDDITALQYSVQKLMMTGVLDRADELQGKLDAASRQLDALNKSATGIDAKMSAAQDQMDAKITKAQDDLVAHMKVEIPKILDEYLKQRVNDLRGKVPQ
ncbi:MAG: hypothetical protein ACLQOO_09425 [Terriglobia bacterium]